MSRRIHVKLESCIVLNKHNTLFARSGPLYAIGVSWAHRSQWVADANGISIASVVSAELTRWQTDWQTDRTRYSIGNNRRSTQWRSKLLLSTATRCFSPVGLPPEFSNSLCSNIYFKKKKINTSRTLHAYGVKTKQIALKRKHTYVS